MVRKLGVRRRSGPGSTGAANQTVKEACGVFGVHAPGRAASHLTFDGLYALQHRGQESAGMAVSDGENITVVKDMGLVTRVFDERTLSGLSGHLAVGHTRYSTHGSSDWAAAQPVYRPVGAAGFALGHNGNLTNTAALADKAGMLPGMAVTDSDVVAELLALHHGSPAGTPAPAHAGTPVPGELVEGLRAVLPLLEGAYSLVLMDAGRLYGVRDPHGFRPLCLGHLEPVGDAPEGWVLASESPALDVVGATFVRELDPGEMVVVDQDGVRSEQVADEVEPRLCIFEFVYFARPDSRLLGREVHGARRRMGELLAEQAPVDADLVMGVPDSGVPAAEGYARRSGIPYGQGLVKNRYIGRTFIEPDSRARQDAVRRKLNPLRENIAAKRLVVVDDSIVRGTNSRAIVGMLRDAGAVEVHLRISSPPFRWPCFYGIDTPTREELLAADRSLEEIERFLGVDSLAYISLANLEAAIGGGGFCEACLTGRYPTAVPVELRAPPDRVPDGLRAPADPGPGADRAPAAWQAALPGV
ncbi:MAG: amidophosphoribosyltransferase [Acidimicrobiales bacterium]